MSVLLGVVLLVVGGALLVLPGPGVFVVIAGLTVLATEFAWARSLLGVARGWADRALAALAASRTRRVLTLLSEIAMTGLGAALLLVPDVNIPLWGWTSGVMLLLSGPVSLAVRMRYRNNRRREDTDVGRVGRHQAALVDDYDERCAVGKPSAITAEGDDCHRRQVESRYATSTSP